MGKAGGSLLRSDKGADRIGVEIFVEVGELERERVIGRVGGHSVAFTNSTRRTDAIQGIDTHHYKGQHWGYPGLP